ncbi:PREDICTED: uncharacterized protein LOC104756966 [Camelina sativa]|uniref:Uncharacterized protein LOC104756966 n=1 Tax=Camelina sativa TaxID=90675 RepID=A0ABM0WYE0_CAMSA|nr:PREDICTED: uncharacterized protein LOC104756966 [Camelina sativa]
MVFPGEMTTKTATRPEQRSKSLHNFPLPNLWGNQRHLKCMKIDDSNGNGGDHHRLRRRSPPSRYSDSTAFRFGGSDHLRSKNAEAFKSGGGGSEEGIEEFRVKLMSDLKTVRDKITQSMFNKDVIEEEREEEEEISGSGSGSGSGQEKEVSLSPVKPWNLRKRRAAACKEPVSDKGIAIEEKVVVTPSLRGGGVVEAETVKKMRPKFAVKLSKKEIEEDFVGMLGHRPPRRPKKRPRTVQKQLDSLFPGLYLTEVTLDAYKVPEETTKR